MRLLTFEIQEPLPGKVLPLMSAETSPGEAARRYRAVALTTLRQLRGLTDTRIQLLSRPDDAAEAIRFWLLPLLSDRWLSENGVYQTDGWEITFADDPSFPFSTRARGEILCPLLGSRWFQAALAGLGATVGEIVGPALQGGTYLHALSDPSLPTRTLPPLPLIQSDSDWQSALQSPLGPALAKSFDQQP